MVRFAMAGFVGALSLLGLLGTLAAQPGGNTSLKFEIRRAESKPAPDLVEALVEGTKNKVYLYKEAALTAKDVAEASASTEGTKPIIQITFTESGKKKMAKLTAEHLGKPLAILVDGKVLAAPLVRDEISQGKAVISGNFTKAEAEKIAQGITAK